MFIVFSVLLQGLRTYLSFRFLLVLPRGQPEQQSPLFSRFSFLLTITKSGRLAEIRWSVCILKSQRILCISFFKKDSGFFVRSNLKFLHNSQWFAIPTQLYLVLYYLCSNLLPNQVLGMTLNCIWLWGPNFGALVMWCIPTLALLPDPLWPGMIVPVRILTMGQIDLFECH